MHNLLKREKEVSAEGWQLYSVLVGSVPNTCTLLILSLSFSISSLHELALKKKATFVLADSREAKGGQK